MYWAAENGHVDAIKVLKEAVVDDSAQKKHEWTSMDSATHVDVMKASKEVGADVPPREQIHDSTKVPDDAQSHSAQELPNSFFSQYHLFPSNSIVLGWLVINTCESGEDFCSISVKLAKEDIAISYLPRLRETVQSVKGSTL